MDASGGVRTGARAGTVVLIVMVVGILVAAAVIARASATVEWRDASLPTYPTSTWHGPAASVAEGLSLDVAVGVMLCPRATLVGSGTTAGVLLADSWQGTWPLTTGLVTGDPVPRLDGGPDGLTLEPRPGDVTSIVGRMLDPGDPDDAALVRIWTDACGPADAVVQAAPGGLSGGEVTTP